jgi:hypothetical protein
METTMLSRRQARWAQALSAYDFTITYRPGKANPADGPSRRPDYEPEQDQENIMLPTLRNKLHQAIELGQGPLLRSAGIDPDKYRAHQGRGSPLVGCSWCLPRLAATSATKGEGAYDAPAEPFSKILRELQAIDGFTLEKRKSLKGQDLVTLNGWGIDAKGILRFRGSAYVPPDQALRMEIFKICHDDYLAGHFGVKKTLELIQRKYYWPELRKETAEYVKGCDLCQRTKIVRHKPYGEMQALPQPEKLFESISMDFVIDLPSSTEPGSSQASDSIFVIVDRYTKVVKYIPCKKTINALELA